MSKREEDIQALYKMQQILKNVEKIDKQLGELDEKENNVTIDWSLYETCHESNCEAEKELKRKENFEKFQAKKKAALAKFWFVPVIFAVAAVVFSILTKKWVIGVAIFVLGFIVKWLMGLPTSNRISKEADLEAKRIMDEYELKLEEAKKADEEEELRYEKDLAAAREKCMAENQAKRQKLKEEKKACKDELEQNRVVSDSDVENIPALLRFLESNRADNIKEALQALDEEKRRVEEEKRRRAEEARRRAEAEAARLAAMPGKVHVRIGSINTYSGKLQSVRNTIYIDGSPYGYGDASGGTVFQLNPGLHSM